MQMRRSVCFLSSGFETARSLFADLVHFSGPGRFPVLGLLAGSAFWLFCFSTVCVAQSEREMTEARTQMVERELVRAGIRNPDVLASMRSTPRHRFVPQKVRPQSYEERALPIGYGQTISSPFVVASMTEALDPQPDDRVLEIGTGSGYQAAVLSPLVKDVYSIEIVTPLARQAMRTLKGLKYSNVHVRAGDGYAGWPEAAPFDKIIVTCSPESPPPALVEQLKDGGMMVVPLGERYAQNLCILKKDGDRLIQMPIRPILFVPMTGEAEENREVLPDPANPVLLNGDFESVMVGKKSEIEKMPERRASLFEEGDVLEDGSSADGLKEFGEEEEVSDRRLEEFAEDYFDEADDRTARKKLAKASFDLLIPEVWCYLRQAQIERYDTGEGKYCLRFRNKKPQVLSQACQGIGVDGREVTALRFRMKIKGEKLVPDLVHGMKPGVYVIFIDEKRNTIRSSIIGGWRGSFDWRTVSFSIDVPPAAREACVFFGLHGACGTLWLDDVEMEAVH